jgi:hypothetical protein
MASGHVNRTQRPNTWLHRPRLRREDSPCQLGAVHTWPISVAPTVSFRVRCRGYICRAGQVAGETVHDPEPTSTAVQQSIRASQAYDRSYSFEKFIDAMNMNSNLRHGSRTFAVVTHRSYLFSVLERFRVMISIIRSAVVPGGKKPTYFPASSTK